MHRKFHKVTWSDFETLEKRVEELSLQRKLELRDELIKELASKADLQTLRAEMQAMEERLSKEIELVRGELDGKIEREILKLEHKLEHKFNIIMFFIIISTLIILFNINKDALEFLLKVLGLIK
jgi:hypothetical protein